MLVLSKDANYDSAKSAHGGMRSPLAQDSRHAKEDDTGNYKSMKRKDKVKNLNLTVLLLRSKPKGPHFALFLPLPFPYVLQDPNELDLSTHFVPFGLGLENDDREDVSFGSAQHPESKSHRLRHDDSCRVL